MKHLIIFVDKLMIALKYIPLKLETLDQRKKEQKTLILMNEYSTILKDLMENHKIQKAHERLEKTDIVEITDWVKHIFTVFQKIEELLKMVDNDVKVLQEILDKFPI